MPPFSAATFGKYTRNWLIGTGIFELALATAFAFGHGWLTAGILGVVGIVLIAFGLRSGARAALLLGEVSMGASLPVKVDPNDPRQIVVE